MRVRVHVRVRVCVCVQVHSDLPVWLSGRSVHYCDRGSRGENQMFTAGESMRVFIYVHLCV